MLFAYSILLFYSYRSDSIGSSFDALFAGSKPKTTPITIENSTPPTTTCHEINGGHPAKPATIAEPPNQEGYRSFLQSKSE